MVRNRSLNVHDPGSSYLIVDLKDLNLVSFMQKVGGQRGIIPLEVGNTA